MQTSGLTVAGRLVEDPNVTVAVLEAGSEHLNDPLIGLHLSPNLRDTISLFVVLQMSLRSSDAN